MQAVLLQVREHTLDPDPAAIRRLSRGSDTPRQDLTSAGRPPPSRSCPAEIIQYPPGHLIDSPDGL